MDMESIWYVDDVLGVILGASVGTASILTDFSIGAGTEEALALVLLVVSAVSLYSKYD